MDDNTKKEEFSYGYIKLLASISGLVVTESNRALDNAGIDINIKAPGEIKGVFSPNIDAQVKCTSRDIVKYNILKYPLPIKNYRRLIGKSSVPQILIIVTVPKEINDWLNITDGETLVKSCAYWISLKGWSATENQTNITVDIPTKNVLTPTVLKDQIETEGDRLNKLLNLESLID
ncbi:MAG: DUF4365 domain-containing protein [Calothrix sp. SM1_7_51]|nr:DUF4365 domain-containing protein [Calothrix sp. SM1_7_51]